MSTEIRQTTQRPFQESSNIRRIGVVALAYCIIKQAGDADVQIEAGPSKETSSVDSAPGTRPTAELLTGFPGTWADQELLSTPFSHDVPIALAPDVFNTSPVVRVQGEPEELAAALSDLDGAIDEASDEGFPLPSGSAVTEAKRILRDLYCLSPRRFEVYPTQDGEIALDAHGDRSSVILLLPRNGSALCLVNIDGDHRRARYSSLKNLPDGFVREALADLDR